MAEHVVTTFDSDSQALETWTFYAQSAAHTTAKRESRRLPRNCLTTVVSTDEHGNKVTTAYTAGRKTSSR